MGYQLHLLQRRSTMIGLFLNKSTIYGCRSQKVHHMKKINPIFQGTMPHSFICDE